MANQYTDTTTDRQSEAARRNGALSTGPASPEGKARSARNNTKHGIYSGNLLLANEDPAAFEEQRAGYHARFQPADPIEASLVDRLFAAQWRIQRMTTLESATIDHMVELQKDDVAQSFESIDGATRTAAAVTKLSDTTKALDLYRRAESSHVRDFERALRTLAKLQDLRRASPSAPIENPDSNPAL